MERFKPKILLALLAVLQLTVLSSAQLPIDQGPDPWTAMASLLTAYGYAQSGCEYVHGRGNTYKVKFDASANTTWYRSNFRQYPPVLPEGYTFNISLPDPGNNTYTSIPLRTASLVCPYKPFPYLCDLAGGVVQTTAVSATKSKTWNIGVTDSLKVSGGFEVLGNGNTETVSITAGYSYNHKKDTIQTESDTVTQAVDSGVTVNPSSGQCAFIFTQLNSLTVSADIQVQAQFRGWVAFQTNEPVYWGSDNNVTDTRIQNIATIVNNSRNIQCGDFFNYNTLPQVAGFYSIHDETGDYVVYSNTYRLDYFQGAQAFANSQPYANTSQECVNQSPPGFENVTWPTNFSDTSTAGRRLLTQTTSKTPTKLTATVRPVSNTEQSYQLSQAGVWEPTFVDEDVTEQRSSSSRKLLQTEKRIRRKDTCPEVAYVTYKHAGKGEPQKAVVNSIPDPHCYGAGLKEYVKARQAGTQMKKALRRLCLISHLPSGPYNASYTDSAGHGTAGDGSYVTVLPQGTGLFQPSRFLVHKSGKQCKFPATKPLNKPWPKGVAPETLDVKLKRLVNAICYFETGADCTGIDYNNAYSATTLKQKANDSNTYWSDSAIPPMTVTLGLVTPNFTDLGLKTDVLQGGCVVGDVNGSVYCQATVSELETQASTTTTTSTQSFQFSAGFSAKWSVNAFGATGSIEVGCTVSGGYSYSTGESSTSTDGMSTTAFVRVPVPPGYCVVNTAFLNKVEGGSAIDAYACMDGLVQVRSTYNCQFYTPCQSECDAFPYLAVSPCQAAVECEVIPGYCWSKGANGVPDGNHSYVCDYNDLCVPVDELPASSIPPAVRSFSMAWAVNFSKDNDIEIGGLEEWHIDDQGRACLNAPISLTYVQGVVAHVDPEIYPLGSDECNNFTIPTGQSTLRLIDTPPGGTGKHYVQDAVFRPIPSG